MSNQKVQLPAYANNPIYKFIDDAITSLIVTIFDAINPKGIVLTDEQVKQIMQKQQDGGAYNGFVQDFLDYFNQLIFTDCPIIGYSLMAGGAYVSYVIITNYSKKL